MFYYESGRLQVANTLAHTVGVPKSVSQSILFWTLSLRYQHVDRQDS